MAAETAAGKRGKRESGQAGENSALEYLRAQGLLLVERNFSCRAGEIDLIMKDRDTLVFVEVRKRGKSRFGTALDSIGKSKQAKLARTAQYYLQKIRKTPPCRFDAVTLDDGRISWIKNIIEET